MKNNRKILLTGGHAATTALSVVEELIQRSTKTKAWDIFWVGPAYAMEGKKIPTLASFSLPRKGVKYHTIIAGRIQRKLTRWSLVSFIKFPLGFLHAVWLIIKIRPNIILSFGGYAAFPIVVIGWIFRIPILLHDQTYSFNRANKLSSPFARKIAVSREEGKKYYPEDKCVLTGNPIMAQIAAIPVKTNIGKPPTLYITGGSTGAVSINNLIEQIINKLLGSYKVIHHAGYLDHKKFAELKSKLPKRLFNNYEVYKSINPVQIGGVYRRADIVLSRSGANTVSEIIVTKRPSLLIPLKIGKWNEQEKNAKYAEKFGIAKVLDQNSLVPKKLYEEIEDTRNNWLEIVDKVKKKTSPDIKASKKLVDLLEKSID